MLRDIVLRYLLVAQPNERLVMETLVDEIARSWNGPYSLPVNVADAELLVASLMRQLPLRQNNASPATLRYITLLVEYTLSAVESLKLNHFYSPIFTAAFNRAWCELDRSSYEEDGESWEDILYHVNILIEAAMYVPFFYSIPIA